MSRKGRALWDAILDYTIAILLISFVSFWVLAGTYAVIGVPILLIKKIIGAIFP